MKKIPMRSCVVTGEKLEKKELIRIVRDNTNHVFIDTTGKGYSVPSSIEDLEFNLNAKRR